MVSKVYALLLQHLYCCGFCPTEGRIGGRVNGSGRLLTGNRTGRSSSKGSEGRLSPCIDRKCRRDGGTSQGGSEIKSGYFKSLGDGLVAGELESESASDPEGLDVGVDGVELIVGDFGMGLSEPGDAELGVAKNLLLLESLALLCGGRLGLASLDVEELLLLGFQAGEPVIHEAGERVGRLDDFRRDDLNLLLRRRLSVVLLLLHRSNRSRWLLLPDRRRGWRGRSHPLDDVEDLLSLFGVVADQCVESTEGVGIFGRHHDLTECIFGG